MYSKATYVKPYIRKFIRVLGINNVGTLNKPKMNVIYAILANNGIKPIDKNKYGVPLYQYRDLDGLNDLSIIAGFHKWKDDMLRKDIEMSMRDNKPKSEPKHRQPDTQLSLFSEMKFNDSNDDKLYSDLFGKKIYLTEKQVEYINENSLQEITIDKKYEIEKQKGKTSLDAQTYRAICQLDPTTKNGNAGQYCNWLLQRITPDIFKQTGLMDSLKVCLEQYADGVKRGILTRSGISNDINSFKSVEEFVNAINSLMSSGQQLSNHETNGMEKLKGQYEIVSETSNWYVVKPLTFAAEQFFGGGTKWCTVANERYFDSYTERSPLFIAIPKGDLHSKKRMQFYFIEPSDGDGSFADVYDEVYTNPKKCAYAIVHGNEKEYKELCDLWGKVDSEYSFNNYNLVFVQDVPELLAKGVDREYIFDDYWWESDNVIIVMLDGKYNFIKNGSYKLGSDEWFNWIGDSGVVELGGKYNYIDMKTGELIWNKPYAEWFDDVLEWADTKTGNTLRHVVIGTKDYWFDFNGNILPYNGNQPYNRNVNEQNMKKTIYLTEKQVQLIKEQLDKEKYIENDYDEKWKKLPISSSIFKSCKKAIDACSSNKSNLGLMDVAEVEGASHYIAIIHGGLNGSGEWVNYLKDIIKILKSIHGSYIIDIDVDVLDDVWTLQLGFKKEQLNEGAWGVEPEKSDSYLDLSHELGEPVINILAKKLPKVVNHPEHNDGNIYYWLGLMLDMLKVKAFDESWLYSADDSGRKDNKYKTIRELFKCANKGYDYLLTDNAKDNRQGWRDFGEYQKYLKKMYGEFKKLEDYYNMDKDDPAGSDKLIKEGNNYVNPTKVLLIKNYLDKNFVRANMPIMGEDGYPTDVKIVGMKGTDGEVIRNMTAKQLFYLLQDKFKGIYADKKKRDALIKQTMIDWYNRKITKDGLLSKNTY